MATLSTKLYAAGTIPGALSAAAAYLASTEPGADAAFLYRLAIALAVIALLLCLITWAHHRITVLTVDRDMEANRVSQLRRQLRGMETRLAHVEDQLRCRLIVKDMWTLDDDEIRSLLNREE